MRLLRTKYLLNHLVIFIVKAQKFGFTLFLPTNFNDTLCFYSNLPASEYTALIGGGILKGRTVRFKDLGVIVNNRDETYPVRLSVARSYYQCSIN